MTAKGWMRICLVMFFFVESYFRTVTSVAYSLSTTNKHNLEILKSKMRTNLPLQCTEDGRGIVPTHKIAKEIQQSLKENLKVAIHELLQQVVHIFSQKLTRTAWDENSMAEFQMRLHQQVKQLGASLNAEMENGIPSPRDQNIQLTRLRMKRYFRRISDFLGKNEQSLCAREMAQMEVKQCLLLVE